jgi:hypothetical protein
MASCALKSLSSASSVDIDSGVRRTLPEDPSRTGPELRILNGAAQTRIVSVARIRLHSGKSARHFKGIFCGDISEFESDHLSHAVGSLPANMRRAGWSEVAAFAARAGLRCHPLHSRRRGAIPILSGLPTSTSARANTVAPSQPVDSIPGTNGNGMSQLRASPASTASAHAIGGRMRLERYLPYHSWRDDEPTLLSM